MSRLYHFFSHGENVLFRSNEDYVFFHNRFVVLCYRANIKILALNILSTHFHSVIEVENSEHYGPHGTSGDEVSILKATLCRSYSNYYCRRYKFAIQKLLSLSAIEFDNIEGVLTRLNYVLKNHCHHFVNSSPYAYDYSVSPFCFWQQFYPEVLREGYIRNCVKLNELSTRVRYVFDRDAILPNDWLVYKRGMISPLSYLAVASLQVFYKNSFRYFNMMMNLPVNDKEGEVIDGEVLAAYTKYKLSDIQVCAVIDDYVAQKALPSFHCLSEWDKDNLRWKLRTSCSDLQISRCLWL